MRAHLLHYTQLYHTFTRKTSVKINNIYTNILCNLPIDFTEISCIIIDREEQKNLSERR